MLNRLLSYVDVFILISHLVFLVLLSVQALHCHLFEHFKSSKKIGLVYCLEDRKSPPHKMKEKKISFWGKSGQAYFCSGVLALRELDHSFPAVQGSPKRGCNEGKGGGNPSSYVH